MTESDYWYDRNSAESRQRDLQHESAMSRNIQCEEFNLITLLNPKTGKDGNQYFVLFGDNLQDGIVGFGDTPYLAVLAFNKAWNAK